MKIVVTSIQLLIAWQSILAELEVLLANNYYSIFVSLSPYKIVKVLEFPWGENHPNEPEHYRNICVTCEELLLSATLQEIIPWLSDSLIVRARRRHLLVTLSG